MKNQALLTLIIAGLASSTSGYAGILDIQVSSDYTNFVCNVTQLSYNADHSQGNVTMDSYQYGGAGLMWGSVTTDSSGDPALMLGGSIDNDTGFAWSGYTIKVFMNKTFNFSGIGVGPTPAGWTFNSTSAALNPTPQYYGPGEYVAQINYSGGPFVPAGGEFDFAYTLNFLGGVNYAVQMTPTLVVPEPGVLGFLALGGLAFGRFLRRSRIS
jgi:hypothetical protein